MAVNYVWVFNSSRKNCYYTDRNGRYSFPVITGDLCDPCKMHPKRVVRIPPSYGSGAYYSRQGFAEDGAYVTLGVDPSSMLQPVQSMDLDTDHDKSGAAVRLLMHSDGLEAECARLTKNNNLQYWYCKYVSSHTYKGAAYFDIEYYNTTMSCTTSTFDSCLSACRRAPRSSMSIRCSQAGDPIESKLEVAPDDWLEPFLWHNLTGVLDSPFSHLASTAYAHLVENLPEVATNSIANVLEIASSLKDIMHGKFQSLDPRDLWLAYRYTYQTSKSDLEEYISLTKRLANLPKLKDITVHSMITYKEVTCRCTAVLSCESIIPSSMKQWLDAYGFRFNAVNAWDMIPYSFVVDWFLHISDFLEEVEMVGRANTLKPKQVWYSFRKLKDNITTYFRVQGAPSRALPVIGATIHKASDKTICYRVADSIALFTS